MELTNYCNNYTIRYDLSYTSNYCINLTVKYDENLGAGLEEKVTNYLASFIKRYGTLVGVKQWISKAKLNDKLKRKLAEVSYYQYIMYFELVINDDCRVQSK